MKVPRQFRSIVLTGAVLVTSCTGIVPTKVQDLLQNPRAFEGKSVLISGKVTDRSSLLVTKYFVLKDTSGEIRVLTDRALPSVGEDLRVRGQVKQAFAFGNSSLVVFQEDTVEGKN